MPGEPRQPDRPPVLVVVLGTLVGLAVGTVVAWALRDAPATSALAPDRPPTAALPETTEAAEAFVAAWERSRRATYITVSRWHRAAATGAEMTETRVFAQRLPDRVRSGDHHRGGRVGDVVYTCDRLPVPPGEALRPEEAGGDAAGGIECRQAPAPGGGPDVEATVAAEVDLMWRHVEGTRPLYRVSQDGDCFHLRLDRLMVVPPYGHRTSFCFDEGSGAVRSLTVQRAEGTDTEELLWVGTEVTDDDLVAIIEGTFDPGPRTPGTRPAP